MVAQIRFGHCRERDALPSLGCPCFKFKDSTYSGKGSVGQTTLVMLGVGLVAVAAVILSTFVMRKSPATPDEGIFKLISRITLDPRTICQPRDGEILFQILFPGYIGTNSNNAASGWQEGVLARNSPTNWKP